MAGVYSIEELEDEVVAPAEEVAAPAATFPRRNTACLSQQRPVVEVTSSARVSRPTELSGAQTKPVVGERSEFPLPRFGNSAPAGGSRLAAMEERMNNLERMYVLSANRHQAELEALSSGSSQRNEHADALGAVHVKLDQVYTRLEVCEGHGDVLEEIKNAFFEPRYTLPQSRGTC